MNILAQLRSDFKKNEQGSARGRVLLGFHTLPPLRRRPHFKPRGRTGSAFVWHYSRRVFEPQLLQQVLRFVGCVNTVLPCNTWNSWGAAHKGGGYDKSIESTVSDAIVRSWLWSTATTSSPLGYFSILLQVVDN